MATIDESEKIRAEIFKKVLQILSSPNSNVTTKILAQHLRIPEPTLYRHYKNKAEIYLSIIHSLQELLEKPFRENISAIGSHQPSEIVFDCFQQHIYLFRTHPGFASFFSFHAVVCEKGDIYDATFAALLKVHLSYKEELQNLLFALFRFENSQRTSKASEFHPSFLQLSAASMLHQWFMGLIITFVTHKYDFSTLSHFETHLKQMLQIFFLNHDN